MSDAENDLIYKRYKQSKHQNKLTLEQIREQADELAMAFGQRKAMWKDKPLRKPLEFENAIS